MPEQLQKLPKEFRTYVKSSNIEYVGWNGEILEVGFHNSGVYQYFDVTLDVFTAILAAPSVGKLINSIKDHYSCVQIDI